MRASTKPLLDLEHCARAISFARPFDTWPRDCLLRLARSAQVASYRRGAVIQAQGATLDSIVVLVSGSIQASAQNRGGRRYTFTLVRGAAVFGWLPLIDGQEMPNDIIASTPVTALVIPFDAVHAELAREPTLWRSVAHEASLRARSNAREWTRLALEPLRNRAAAMLLALAQASDPAVDGGPVTLGVPLPQERLGEMLGVSRQTATMLVRDLVDAGVVRWRYGRVTVLDVAALRKAANASVNDKT